MYELVDVQRYTVEFLKAIERYKKRTNLQQLKKKTRTTHINVKQSNISAMTVSSGTAEQINICCTDNTAVQISRLRAGMWYSVNINPNSKAWRVIISAYIQLHHYQLCRRYRRIYLLHNFSASDRFQVSELESFLKWDSFNITATSIARKHGANMTRITHSLRCDVDMEL